MNLLSMGVTTPPLNRLSETIIFFSMLESIFNIFTLILRVKGLRPDTKNIFSRVVITKSIPSEPVIAKRQAGH